MATVDPTPGAHMTLRALDPPRAPSVSRERRWCCPDCGKSGTFDEMRADRSCSFVPAPCAYCGQVRECAIDCAGMMAVLSAPSVAVVTSDTRIRQQIETAKKKRGQA